MPSLYLVPTPIVEDGIGDISPVAIQSVMEVRNFVVENLKTARRVLRKMGFRADFDSEVAFFEWDKHADAQDYRQLNDWLDAKLPIAVMSEAGLPCIADPGNQIVALAHKHNYRIVPLSGPSSILLALISSGFNGQNFAFSGYLPIDKNQRIQKLKQLEQRLRSEKQTQIFMETPYRNTSFLEDILQSCSGDIALSIAANIGSKDAFIRSAYIHDWKKNERPTIHKKPCVFSLGFFAIG